MSVQKKEPFIFSGINLRGVLKEVAEYLQENSNKVFTLEQVWAAIGLPFTSSKNESMKATEDNAKFWERKNKQLITDFFFVHPPAPFCLDDSGVRFSSTQDLAKDFFSTFNVDEESAPQLHEKKKPSLAQLKEFGKKHKMKGIRKLTRHDLLEKIIQQAQLVAPTDDQLKKNGFLKKKILNNKKGERVWEVRKIISRSMVKKEIFYIVEWTTGGYGELHESETGDCQRAVSEFYKSIVG
jgi:hypothetical protein